jgi:hypothetical protein
VHSLKRFNRGGKIRYIFGKNGYINATSVQDFKIYFMIMRRKKRQITTAFRQTAGGLKMLLCKENKILPFIRALPEYYHQKKM